MFFRLTRFGTWRLNLVIRLGSFWIGVHRSSAYDSYCIALLPCIVLQFINNDTVPLDCKTGEVLHERNKSKANQKTSNDDLWY